MHDELTKVDIEKMQEEIDYRIRVLRPQLIEEVQTTRASVISAKISSIRKPSGPKTATTAASVICRTW